MTEWTVNNKLNDWYEKQYHIKLPKKFETKSRLYFSRNNFVYLSFIPSGSTGLITADSLVFRVVGVETVPNQITDNMWALVPIAGGLRVDLAPYPDDGSLT